MDSTFSCSRKAGLAEQPSSQRMRGKATGIEAGKQKSMQESQQRQMVNAQG